MIIFFAAVALLGLILFAVGAILWLFAKPNRPTTTILMVIGGLLYAVGEGVLLLDLLF